MSSQTPGFIGLRLYLAPQAALLASIFLPFALGFDRGASGTGRLWTALERGARDRQCARQHEVAVTVELELVRN